MGTGEIQGIGHGAQGKGQIIENFRMNIEYPIKHKFFFFLIFFLVISRPALAEEPSGFLSITGPCNLEFPKDHGAHPGYRTEWWYYTGNLLSEDGDPFGFQLTFFRRQISPPGAEKTWPDPPSAWRTQQIYMAHAAVSDVAGNRHLQAESLSRGALTMAGVQQRPSETVVYLKSWSARIGHETQLLEVDTDDFAYKLTLTPVKPPILHGQAGYSLKGSSPERASCYYSYTRFEINGRLTIRGKTLSVKGQGWMDHEFSSAALEPGIKGWDWFSLQLSDQTEIMLFFLRTADGGIGSASGGTFIDPEGRARAIGKDEITVTPLDVWKSPHSKAVYPSRWRLQILPYSLNLTIFPNLADQEMSTFDSTGITYWEGSVSIRGTKNENPIEGQGYVELTGYAEDFDVPM
jgi:predicted secreted hydrolase